MLYRLKGIYHNGRNGTRWDLINDKEYVVQWNINDIRQFKPTKFIFQNTTHYDYQKTSEVLQLSRRFSSDGTCVYELETMGSIYVLEKIA